MPVSSGADIVFGRRVQPGSGFWFCSALPHGLTRQEFMPNLLFYRLGEGFRYLKQGVTLVQTLLYLQARIAAFRPGEPGQIKLIGLFHHFFHLADTRQAAQYPNSMS
jgi:hypothetical protein